MVCNLDFANNTILLCFLFLNYWIILFNQIIAQILNLIAELVILTGIPTKHRNGNTSSNCRNYNKLVFDIIQNSTKILCFLLIKLFWFISSIKYFFFLICFLQSNCLIYVFFQAWLFIFWYSSILLIKTKIFNISIDFSSSYLWPDLL